MTTGGASAPRFQPGQRGYVGACSVAGGADHTFLPPRAHPETPGRTALPFSQPCYYDESCVPGTAHGLG